MFLEDGKGQSVHLGTDTGMLKPLVWMYIPPLKGTKQVAKENLPTNLPSPPETIPELMLLCRRVFLRMMGTRKTHSSRPSQLRH
jgi:hypothetical protein